MDLEEPSALSPAVSPAVTSAGFFMTDTQSPGWPILGDSHREGLSAWTGGPILGDSHPVS
jgi:hypothetical protein